MKPVSSLERSKDQVITSYENGWTLTEIALAHGVVASTVARFLEKHGVKRRGRGREKHGNRRRYKFEHISVTPPRRRKKNEERNKKRLATLAKNREAKARQEEAEKGLDPLGESG